jgi:hypothetical protein
MLSNIRVFSEWVSPLAFGHLRPRGTFDLALAALSLLKKTLNKIVAVSLL